MDTFPTELTSVTWTCSASSGSVLRFGQWHWQLEHDGELARGRHGDVHGERDGERVGERYDHEHGDGGAPSGVTDTNPNNNTRDGCGWTNPTADLAISKTDEQTTVVPGKR